MTFNLSEKKALIFDFDGTLADSSKIHERAFASVISPYGVEFNYNQVSGMNTLDALTKIFNESNINTGEIDIGKLAIEKQKIARKIIARDLSLFPGVFDFLNCARKIYTMVLCTSGSRESVNLALNTTKIKNIFDIKIFSEDVKKSKPSPDGYLKALEMLNLSAEYAIVFEDSPNGIKSAYSAGIDCIDVNKLNFFQISSVLCKGLESE